MIHKRPLAVAGPVALAGAALAATLALASPGGSLDPAATTALAGRLVQSSMLLSVIENGGRLVAVGERGHILLSDDGGAAWRQAKAPTQVTLASIRFATHQVGWAVGHSGTILKTSDGGETWQEQMDGVRAARLALSSAEAAGDQRRIRKARRWVEDGPDKPLLSLAVVDEMTAFAFGAYGLALTTEDGGVSWTAIDDRLDNPESLHVNAAAIAGGSILLAGEQGLLLRSDDAGASFHALPSPYAGSFFDVFPHPAGRLVVVGLRGYAYRSEDGGKTWVSCARPVEETLLGGGVLADGRNVLVTAGGHLLVGDAACDSLSSMEVPGAGPLAGIAVRSDGQLILVGAAGLTRLNLPSQSEVGR